MTAEERLSIQEAARRYVRELAPKPPAEVLEHVALIVVQSRAPNHARNASNGIAASP